MTRLVVRNGAARRVRRVDWGLLAFPLVLVAAVVVRAWRGLVRR